MQVLGICGSLRADSFNGMALALAGQSLPTGTQMEVLDWGKIPPFDADVLTGGFPSEVMDARERMRRADAIVIATPEYNFSIPGMLKNLLDWISRGEDQPLSGKPVAILSVSTGPLGGGRVQYDLRRVLLFLDAMVMSKPEVFIGQAQLKFSGDGRCIDDATAKFVRAQMQTFSNWISAVHRMQR